jgi:PAS domain S-box-containing protein
LDNGDPPPLRLLLIDDVPGTIDHVDRLLAETGLKIILNTLADRGAALAALGENRHDLCLMAGHFRQQGGMDLLKAALHAGSMVPIVLLVDEEHSCCGDADGCILECEAQDALFLDTLTVSALRRCIRQVTTRDRLQRQLRASQAELRRHGAELERLKDTLDAHAIVSVTDVYGNITYVNDLFCQVSGYGRAELIGQNHRLLKSGRHDAAFYGEMWSRLANGQIWQGEVCNRRKDGSCYWVRGTIVPFAGEDGLPYQYVSVRTDVTEIKQAEEELRLFGQALESSVDGIAIADARKPDIPLIYVNPAFVRMTGYRQEDFVGRNCRFLQGPETDQMGLAEIRTALAEGRPGRALLRNYRKDGSLFWNDFSIAPVWDEQGEVSHYIGVANDVTSRQAAEAALQKSEERLRRSQVYADIGTWDWDIKSGELYWSERIGPLFGYQGMVDTTYENFLAAVHPDDRQLVIDGVTACVERGEKYEVEHRVVWSDGSVRWMLERGDVTRDPDGSPSHMLGVVQDITDRRLAQERLQASEARLANAQRIAHLGNWDYDLVSGKIVWSEEVYGIFGVERGSVSPDIQSYYQWTHPDDRNLVHQAEERTALEGKGEIVHRIVRQDGGIRHVRLIGEVAKDNQGRPLYMTGTVQDITALKLAEEALRQSEALLRQFYELSPLGIAQNSMDGRFLQVNQALLAMTGYREKELHALSYWELTPQEYEADELGQLESLKQTGRYGPYEKEYIHKDGHRFPVLLTGIRLIDGQGREVIWSIVQDISERRRGEQALQQLAERNRVLMESAHDGILLADLAGHIIDANRHAEVITGHGRDQLLKMHASQLHPASAQAQVAAAFRNIVSHGHVLEHIDVERPDGTLLPVDISATLIDKDGERYILGMFRDMSEQRQAERQIRDIGERFRGLVETTVDWIWEVDDQGRYTYCSPRVRDLLGYAPEEVVGKTPFDLMSPQEAERVGQEFAAIMAAQRAFQGLINRNQHKDGHAVVLETSGVPIFDEAGKLIGYRGIDRDVTERFEREEALRIAKEEAERANQAKSLFLSSMSHELRTPMNAILGFAQLLQMHQELTADQGENVEEILRAGRHLLALINEVLDLAKIEAGHLDLALEPVSCCELAKECLNLVRPLAERHGIHIRQDYQVVCPIWFLADRTRLKQVIVNLLSNAIKYNRPEGSVTLRALPGVAGYLRIEVEDSGLGIRPEQRAGLFQPFHRLHDVDSGIEGTGIGLTISKRLIEAMDGRIGLESIFGVGSTFWLELPVPESSSLPAEDAGKVGIDCEDRAGAASVTLLYVEDNPANLRLLQRIAQTQSGWKLYTAHEPRLGLDLARAHAGELDAILLDINLPGMDGYTVLERLQAETVTAAIPVVAISANAMHADIRRGEAAGFAAYLTKPLDLGQFHATLNGLLAGRVQADDFPSQ